MSRALKITVGVVAGLLLAIVAALAGLLAFGTAAPPTALASLGAPFRHVDFSDLPAVDKIPVRHGSPIAFRVWRQNPPAGDPAGLVVIAIHGSSASSASIHPLGKALSAQGITVYAPDIRGHGATGVRGDIDYAGELDDDLADLVAMVRSRQPNASLVLMGFSSGGGFALHVAALPLGKMFERTVLLSPMLGADAPTYKAGDYANPFIPRIIAIALLDRIGIHVFDHLTTLLLAIDPARTDILTGHYSWLLMRAFGTRDYAADLRNARTPLAVVVGGNDELFAADKFAPTVNAIRPGTPVTIVPGLSHTALTTEPGAVPAILAAARGQPIK